MSRASELLQQGLGYERGGALERALERYEAVVQADEEPAWVARALVRISHTRRTRCEWDAALEAAARAVTVAEAAGLAREHAEALNAEAAVHHSRGEFARARSFYERIPEVTADARVRGMAYQNLGAIAAVEGDGEVAEARFGEALDCFTAAGDPSGEAFVLNSFTALAVDRKDFVLAEERGRAAVDAARRVGDLDLLGVASSNYAEALGGLGRFEEAEAAATAALGHFQTSGNAWRRVQCLRTLGLLSEARGDAPTARRFYSRGLELARDLGADAEIVELTQRLAASGGEGAAADGKGEPGHD